MKSFIFVIAVSALVMANAIPLPKEKTEAKQFGALGNMAASVMPSTPSNLGLGMKVASAVVSVLSTGNPIEDAQRLYKLYKAYEAITDFAHTINPMTYLPSSSQALTDLENMTNNIIPPSISNMLPAVPSIGRQLLRPPTHLPPFSFPHIPPFPQVPQAFPFPSPPTQGQAHNSPPLSLEELVALISQLQKPAQAPQTTEGQQTPETKFIPINLPLFPLLENETFRKIICLLDSLNPFNNQDWPNGNCVENWVKKRMSTPCMGKGGVILKIDFCFEDEADEDAGSDDAAGDDAAGDDAAGGDAAGDDAAGDDTAGDDAAGDDAAGDDAAGDDAAGDDAAGDDAAGDDAAGDDADAGGDDAVEEVVTEDRPPRPNRVSLTPERLQELLGLLGDLTQNGGGFPGLPNIFG